MILYEHGDKPFVSVKFREFIDELFHGVIYLLFSL